MVTYGSDHMPIKIGTLRDLIGKYQEFRLDVINSKSIRPKLLGMENTDFHDLPLGPSACQKLFYIGRDRKCNITQHKKYSTSQNIFRQVLIQKFRKSSGLQFHFSDILLPLGVAQTSYHNSNATSCNSSRFKILTT